MPASSPKWQNRLFFGDNLKVLQLPTDDEDYIQSNSVDLIYLDPPFNSDATYNVLFKAKDGSRSDSQLQAFNDTWQWYPEGAASYFATVERGPASVSRVLQAFRTILGESNMLAYLSMM